MTRRVTIYSQFVEEWSGCKLCPSWEGRHKVVNFRGKIPCDVAFVGEAPGETEDTFGKPFWGPAGKMLDYIVKRSVPSELRVGIMNLVGCIPRDEENDRKATEPSDESILTCQPRIARLLEICNPSVVVAVGKHAKDYLDQGYKHSIKLPKDKRIIHITHPAALLRMNVAVQGFEVQRAAVIVANAVRDMLEARDNGEETREKREDGRPPLGRPRRRRS